MPEAIANGGVHWHVGEGSVLGSRVSVDSEVHRHGTRRSSDRGIYRISSYAPEKRISFNQFLIDDDEPALIHTGTFPMYADVRAAVGQVLDPSRLRYVIAAHFEADECGGMGRFVAEAPESMLACSMVGARINLQQWD